MRADFLVSDDGVFAGEINAVPGSLAYYLFCERLIDGRKFLTDLLNEPFFGNRREPLLPETGCWRACIREESGALPACVYKLRRFRALQKAAVARPCAAGGGMYTNLRDSFKSENFTYFSL